MWIGGNVGCVDTLPSMRIVVDGYMLLTVILETEGYREYRGEGKLENVKTHNDIPTISAIKNQYNV